MREVDSFGLVSMIIAPSSVGRSMNPSGMMQGVAIGPPFSEIEKGTGKSLSLWFLVRSGPGAAGRLGKAAPVPGWLRFTELLLGLWSVCALL